MSATPHDDAGATPPDGLPPPRLYFAVAVILCGIALSVLDAAVVNVALPSIARQFGVTPSAAIWVVNAYQIAIVVAMLPLATLGDRIGYRRVYRAGVALFVLSSVACILSSSITALGVARAFQGLGAAGIMSVNAALVRVSYPRRLLPRGIALNSMVVAASAAAGPTLGGVILAFADWTWLFLVNLPLGLLVLFGSLRYLPASTTSSARYDYLSALLSVLTFGLLFISVDLLSHASQKTVGALMLVAGVVIAVIFVRRQLRLPLPLLPVDLLRIPLFGLSIATSICSFAAQMMAMVALPFLLQNRLGFTPVETGLLMTPWPLALMLAAPASARLLERYPAGLLGGIGLVLLASGLVALGLLPAAPSHLDIGWRMALCGLGFGLFQSPNNHTILTSGPVNRSGGASGMLGTARLVGQTSGAIVASLLFSLLPGHGQIVMFVAGGLALAGAGVSLLRVRAGQQPVSNRR